MIWINHQATTAITVFAFTHNIGYTLIATAASVIPDRIETPPWAFEKEWEYRRQHRKASHYFVPYAVIFLLCIGFLWNRPVFWELAWLFDNIGNGQIRHLIPNLSAIGASISIGCLLHIAEDAVCGTVPDWKMRPDRWGRKWFSVRSPEESMAVLLYCLAMFCLSYLTQ